MRNKGFGNGQTLSRGLVFGGVASAAFAVAYKCVDNIVVHHYVTADDRLTAAFAYLVVGAWTGTLMGVVFAMLVGRRLIDQDFNGFVIRNRRMHVGSIVTGAISAVSTLFLLLGTQFGDPGALAALGSATILYTTGYDVFWSKEVKLRSVSAPLIAALAGSWFAAYNGSLALTVAGALFVLLISNGLRAVSEIMEQDGARASDGVNFFCWRFFWLAAVGTMIAFSVSALRGKTELLHATMGKALGAMPIILVGMSFVFFSNSLVLTLKRAHAVSLVMLVTSIQLAMMFPATLLGELIRPGLFGRVSMSPAVWAVRILGAAALIWSIRRLRAVPRTRKEREKDHSEQGVP